MKEFSESVNNANATRRLCLDEQDKILVGVSGGIANYLGIPPFFVRVLFILTTIFGAGTGYIVYIILAIFLPDDPREAAKRKTYFEKNNSLK